MTTKSQIKTRYSRFGKSSNFGDGEIIVLGESTNNKSKVYQKRKELTENTSSEATTPNKRRIKKKKTDNESIEIYEVKNNGKGIKNRRENSKMITREINRKERGKNKSVDKIRKNSMNNKKENKMKSIALEESDDEVEEINISSNVKNPSKRNIRNRKYASKTPDKKERRKNIKNNNIPKNKKMKVADNKNRMTQYELSSEESEVEMTQGKIKTGSLSSGKASQSQKKNEEEEDNKKSRSTIKVSKENSSLLGKKRKNERNTRSRTPNKTDKSQIVVVNKVPIEIKNSPVKMRAGKSSKTPLKNYPKKNKNISEVDSGSRNYVTPELALLNHLISDFGFEKVLDSLCKAKLDRKDKLDSCVQGLRDSCANEKLPLFLIKMMFSYFDNKGKDKKEKMEEEVAEKIPPEILPQKIKEKEKDNKKSLSFIKSCSTEITNTNNELIEPSEKPLSKSPTKASNSNVNKIDTNTSPIILEEQTSLPIQLTEEPPKLPIKLTDEMPQKIDIPKKEEKKKEDKSPIKARNEEVKKEKKNMSIGSHYHKNEEDGMLYKYQVYKLDGQGNAVFKCYDDKCASEGIYELDSRKFIVTVKHNLEHKKHDYINNCDKNDDNVFKEMINLNKNDAQVFKEGNERSVKLY